jgi:endo-1,4-beta-xylanase
MKNYFHDSRCQRILIPLLCLGIASNAIYIKAGPIAEGASKFLGNISTSTPPSNFMNYWNQVTLENDGKWANVEGTRGQFNWSSVSGAYNYCRQNKIPYKHHTFVWGTTQGTPSWFSGLSAADKKAEVEKLIKAYGEQFPETDFIDVVNEAREKSGVFKDALGGAGTTGCDWIVWAFTTARKYCPKAKLLINEYYCEKSLDYVTQYLKIVNVLKEKNLIDGVGLQTHDGETKTGYTTGVLKQCLDSLATAGVPLYSTEFDMAGTDSAQLDWYKKIFPIIWEHPAIKGVTIWGWTSSWLPTAKVGDGRLIVNNVERPALKWLKEYVAAHKNIATFVGNDNAITIAASSKSSFIACGPTAGNYRFLFAPSNAGSASLQIFDILGRCIASGRIDNTAEPFTFTFPQNRAPHTPFIAKVSDKNGAYAQQKIPVR